LLRSFEPGLERKFDTAGIKTRGVDYRVSRYADFARALRPTAAVFVFTLSRAVTNSSATSTGASVG
jgi:hypothetical protein